MNDNLPPRPLENDPRLIEVIAGMLVDDVHRWTDGFLGEEDVLASLKTILGKVQHDAYKLARALEEDHGFEPDFDLVCTLDEVSGYKRRAHLNLVREWVHENKIHLEYKMGDIVCHEGVYWEIQDLRPEMAQYLLHDTWINFEEVVFSQHAKPKVRRKFMGLF